MEGDREVVREGEEKTKKQGWFSRDKTTAQNTKNVQRPPSSLSLPRHSTSTPASGSDDLPERLASSTHPPDSPEEAVSRDSTASIPIHAGFDFKAISEMLEREGGKDKDELRGMQIPTNEPLTDHTLPAQSDSSVTPRDTLIAPGISSKFPSVHEVDPDMESGIESETRADLAQTLSHSLSLNDVSDRTASSPSQHKSTLISDPSSITEPTSTSRFTSAARPPPAPTLSFGSSDGSLWTSAQDTHPPQDQSTFGGIVSKSPFAPSTDTLSFSGNTGSSHLNPFTAPGLSFGSADGAISHGDSWVLPPKDGVSKKPSYSTNPWG
jgi:hypothetical protein